MDGLLEASELCKGNNNGKPLEFLCRLTGEDEDIAAQNLLGQVYKHLLCQACLLRVSDVW